jgi:hypothetical protein
LSIKILLAETFDPDVRETIDAREALIGRLSVFDDAPIFSWSLSTILRSNDVRGEGKRKNGKKVLSK